MAREGRNRTKAHLVSMRSHKKAKTQSKPDAQWSLYLEKKTTSWGTIKVGSLSILLLPTLFAIKCTKN